MKKLRYLLLASVIVYLAISSYSKYLAQIDALPAAEQGAELSTPAANTGSATPAASADTLRRAFDERQSNVPVQASGIVDRLLRDDTDGSRHQRIVVRLPSGQTVLLAHNIELASRVPAHVGDRLEFFGEYAWNPQGGVVHWTHHDPQGRHASGWIKHQGQSYQ